MLSSLYHSIVHNWQMTLVGLAPGAIHWVLVQAHVSPTATVEQQILIWVTALIGAIARNPAPPVDPNQLQGKVTQ